MSVSVCLYVIGAAFPPKSAFICKGTLADHDQRLAGINRQVINKLINKTEQIEIKQQEKRHNKMRQAQMGGTISRM